MGEIAVDIFQNVLIALLAFAGVVLAAVRLPGTWLILIVATVYGWFTDWQAITGGILIILVVAAVLGELAELLSAAVTVRKTGASRKATWGALIGGFAGMFVFSLPLPIIGTIFGAMAGCFAGALIGEMMSQKNLRQGTRVGKASVVGFVLGMAIKTAIAFMMAGLLVGASIKAAITGEPVTVEKVVSEPLTETPEPDSHDAATQDDPPKRTPNPP